MWQVVQRKVDIPIVDKATCQTKVKAALNAKKAGIGDKVTISPSEVSTFNRRSQQGKKQSYFTVRFRNTGIPQEYLISCPLSTQYHIGRVLLHTEWLELQRWWQ